MVSPRQRGGGRATLRATQARADGDIELADRLTPPSERKLREDEMCGALSSKGTPCRWLKGRGTDHPGYGNCSKHGGNTEAGIKSAMRQMGEDLIDKFKAEQPFGGDRTDPSIASLTPEAALIEEVRRSAAMVRFLESRIQQWELTPSQRQSMEELFEKRTKDDRQGRGSSLKLEVDRALNALLHDESAGEGTPTNLPPLSRIHPSTGITSFTDAREWLYLYREERAHLARVSKMAIDAGVAERLVTLAENQGRVISSAIRAVLNALSLTPEQAALVPQVVPPILRAVANDQPIPALPQLLPATPASPGVVG